MANTSDVLKTINRAQVRRLENLGATVANTEVTATEQQLWDARILADTRRLLELRDNLTIV